MATRRARLTLARFNEQKAELPPARGVNRDAELTAPSALAPKLRLDRRAVGSGDWLGVAALRATRVKKVKCLMSTGDKGFQNGLQGNVSFLRVGFPALKINPAFVEAVQHPDPWNRILHPLRLE
jgi:hypothetical protein